MIEVREAGGLTLFQDRGRPGLAHLGIAPSGAFDVAAHDAANAAVGNVGDEATLEVLQGPLVLTARTLAFVAVTGAAGGLTLDRLALAHGRAFALPPGARLQLAPGTGGGRRYVAVAGGFDVGPVLGSRSRDTLGGLGPESVRAGDVLRVGVAPGAGAPPGGRRSTASGTDSRADGVTDLAVLPGPRPELFPPDVLERLAAATYLVTSASDRVAVRLAGDGVQRLDDAELPPEPLVAGAIQVPPSGQPVIFGPDHPLTGGYPVVGVLTRTALGRLAQCLPGEGVRLVRASSSAS